MNAAAARRRMVERQLRARGIEDERVLAAMAEVPREEFVPAELRGRAYDDSALPIGEEQTISQPWIVAAICQALELRGPELVLEVGTGSGYSAAVLSLLAGHVVSIERHEALSRGAARGAGLARRSATSSWWSATAASASPSGARSTRSPSTPPRRRRRRPCSPSWPRAAGWSSRSPPATPTC